jgi:ABC-type glycerol-3-phosphate transport system substrate-binding protein
MWLLKGNKHPDEAWDLLQYLTIGAGGAAFLKAQARPSPVIAVNEDPAFAQGNTFWPAITDVMNHEKALPRTGVNSKLDAIGLTMLEEALFKKKSPIDALNQGAEQAQKTLDEYWAS